MILLKKITKKSRDKNYRKKQKKKKKKQAEGGAFIPRGGAASTPSPLRGRRLALRLPLQALEGCLRPLRSAP